MVGGSIFVVLVEYVLLVITEFGKSLHYPGFADAILILLE